MATARSQQRALMIVLIASMILVAMVLRPMAIALMLAAVLAGALWPAHNRLRKWLRYDGISAGVLVLLVFLLLTGPLLWLTAFLVKEGIEAVRFVTETVKSDGMTGLIEQLPDGLERAARWVADKLGGLEEAIKAAPSGGAASVAASAVAATGSLVLQTALMLIALFFFLTQKEDLLKWVAEASPLRRGQTQELLAEFRRVSVAVLRSSALTALVQATAAFVGYLIARVPHPFFFAALTFFTALIPAVGAASVCLLAAALLYFGGHTVAAIFLAIWGVAVVGLSDNIVKPILIKGGMEMHGGIVFFSLLGGLAAFGPIGLLLGPLAISLFIAVLRIYRRDYGEGGTPGATEAVDRRTAQRGPRGE